MSNRFQIMNLIILEGSSLLAADHTQLLQVFIFASWSSTPVTMRVGWDPEQTPHCTVFLHAWLLIALAHLKVFFKSEKRRCLLLFFIGVCALQCFRCQSSASTSWGMLTINLLRNYEPRLPVLEHYPKLSCAASLNGSLSERESTGFYWSWMIFACQTVKDPGKRQETVDI